MSSKFRKITFISTAFLLNLADIIFLYAIPALIYVWTRDVLWVMFFMGFKVLGRVFVRRRLGNGDRQKTFYHLILQGLTFALLIVIIVNKAFNIYFLAFIILFESLFFEYFTAGSQQVLDRFFEYSPNGKKLYSWMVLLAYILGPLLVGLQLMAGDFIAIMETFYFIAAIGGALFIFFIYKYEPLKLDEAVRHSNVNISNTPKLSIAYASMGFMKNVFLVLSPIYVFENAKDQPLLLYLVPLFLLPKLISVFVFDMLFKRTKFSFKLTYLMVCIFAILLIWQNLMGGDRIIYSVLLIGISFSLAESLLIKQTRDIYPLKNDAQSFLYNIKTLGYTLAIIVAPMLWSVGGYSFALEVSGIIVTCILLIYAVKYIVARNVNLKLLIKPRKSGRRKGG
jgi:hypothetical protein